MYVSCRSSWWFDSFYRTGSDQPVHEQRGYALEFRFGGQLCHAYPPSRFYSRTPSLRTLSREPSHKHSISIKPTLLKGVTGYRYSTIVTSDSTLFILSSRFVRRETGEKLFSVFLLERNGGGRYDRKEFSRCDFWIVRRFLKALELSHGFEFEGWSFVLKGRLLF